MGNLAGKGLMWATPLVALGLIGAVALGTSKPKVEAKSDGDGSTKGTSEKVLEKAHFDHEKDIETYLTSIRSFMLVPPRNGLFGASRVPTLHGTSPMKVPGYDKVNELIAKDYSVVSFVMGKMPEKYLNIYEQGVKNGQMKESDVPRYRITPVHQNLMIHRPQEQSGMKAYQQKYGAIQNAIYNKTNEAQALCSKDELDTYSDSFKVENKQTWFIAKSVRATDKSCYSCHVDVKEGQPIGYVIAFLMKN